MLERIIKLKKLLLESAKEFRLKIATHPKVVIWRLRFFGVHPFLGKHFLRIIEVVVIFVFVFSIFYVFSWRAPRPFPEQSLVTAEKGQSLSQITRSLKEAGVVRSSFWLKVFVMFLGGEKRVVAGDYYFPKAINAFSVAKKIHRGEFGLIAKKITIPEGTSSYEMAEIFEKELPAFKKSDFLNEVKKNNYEGYLFPDTYFFSPNIKSSEIIMMMRENFARQTNKYSEDISKFQKPLNEIVIIASIIEDEANGTLESKRIISGILWKRLRLGMPLQVDAPFVYYNGKNSYTLTKDDLAEDHKYNTYVNKGLPPTAITNPGLDSLRAAIAPTQTSYLYFLSDKKGNIYYAKDFEDHKRNKELYLR